MDRSSHRQDRENPKVNNKAVHQLERSVFQEKVGKVMVIIPVGKKGFPGKDEERQLLLLGHRLRHSTHHRGVSGSIPGRS